MTTPITHDLLVIDNAVVDALLANPAVREAFPSCFAALAQIKPARAGCSSCQQRAVDGHRAAAYQTTRSCLAHLANDKKILLKQLLGARRVRLVDNRMRITF